MQGDEQEPDKRCGTSGTSGHVTAKSSIRNWGVLYKSGVYASKVMCLTLGGLPCATRYHERCKRLREEQSSLTAWEKSAEGIVGEVPMSELKPSPDKRGGYASSKA